MVASEDIKLVLSKGIKVYPEINRYRKFAVCVEDTFNLVYKRKKTFGEYKHTTESINNAIEATINKVAEMLKTK